MDIAIDENTGNIAVADYSNHRVQLFSPEGRCLDSVSCKEITEPTSVAFTKSSNLIVVASNKIFCFSESGTFVNNISNKHLNKPYRLTIARDGRMLVCDWDDNTVKVPFSAVSYQDIFVVSYFSKDNVKAFSKDGVFLHSIGTLWYGDRAVSFCWPLS